VLVQQKAKRDALSMVPNRYGLDDWLTRHFCTRDTAALTLLEVDVDHFKRIHDLRGNTAGDLVLRAAPMDWPCAGAVTNLLRGSGVRSPGWVVSGPNQRSPTRWRNGCAPVWQHSVFLRAQGIRPCTAQSVLACRKLSPISQTATWQPVRPMRLFMRRRWPRATGS